MSEEENYFNAKYVKDVIDLSKIHTFVEQETNYFIKQIPEKMKKDLIDTLNTNKSTIPIRALLIMFLNNLEEKGKILFLNFEKEEKCN